MLIALLDLLDVDDFYTTVSIEQDAVVSDSKPVAGLMIDQCLDILNVRHVDQCLGGIVELWLIGLVDIPELFDCLARPIDRVHAWPALIGDYKCFISLFKSAVGCRQVLCGAFGSRRFGSYTFRKRPRAHFITFR